MADAMPASGGEEIVELLSGLALFADLTRPELEAVAHTFVEEWINDGQRVLRRGFGGSSFYVIVDGTATVEVEGTEVNRLGRGDFFGEVSLLLGEKPSADVTAVGPLRCVVLSSAELQEFLLAYPKVCYRMLQAEARKLWKTAEWRS
jgi:CRP-like cAMP-binding protein